MGMVELRDHSTQEAVAKTLAAIEKQRRGRGFDGPGGFYAWGHALNVSSKSCIGKMRKQQKSSRNEAEIIG
jgi:hypothetical protein